MANERPPRRFSADAAQSPSLSLSLSLSRFPRTALHPRSPAASRATICALFSSISFVFPFYRPRISSPHSPPLAVRLNAGLPAARFPPKGQQPVSQSVRRH